MFFISNIIKSRIEISSDNDFFVIYLENSVVKTTGRKHEISRRMECPEPGRERKVPFNGHMQLVVSETLALEGEGRGGHVTGRGALLPHTIGLRVGTGSPHQTFRALTRVPKGCVVGHALFVRRTGLVRAFIDDSVTDGTRVPSGTNANAPVVVLQRNKTHRVGTNNILLFFQKNLVFATTVGTNNFLALVFSHFHYLQLHGPLQIVHLGHDSFADKIPRVEAHASLSYNKQYINFLLHTRHHILHVLFPIVPTVSGRYFLDTQNDDVPRLDIKHIPDTSMESSSAAQNKAFRGCPSKPDDNSIF